MRVHSLLTIQDKYTPWKYLGDMDKNGKGKHFCLTPIIPLSFIVILSVFVEIIVV